MHTKIFTDIVTGAYASAGMMGYRLQSKQYLLLGRPPILEVPAPESRLQERRH